MLSEDMNYLLFNFEIILWNQIIRKHVGNMLSFYRKRSFENYWKWLVFIFSKTAKFTCFEQKSA